MAARKSFDILRDKSLYKSIAFTRKERLRLGLEGLLPHVVATESQLVDRAMNGLRALPRDIDRYMALSSMQERHERLFYRTLMTNIEETMPWIYTPTVGQACSEFSHIAREPKGFYITPDDRGRIGKYLDNWPEKDIRVIVVTDGQRILGLGDLGANGMGIPVGKLALYTACAGIPPKHCLPVMLDVGTNNTALLDDPLYIGYPRRRLSGRPYFALVDEFVRVVQKKYPNALIQFEDFQTPDAYALLNTYRDRVLCFNDDIQGTAAVALAGVSASTRVIKRPLRDLRIMFLGAGSAATGIADLMAAALVSEGLSLAGGPATPVVRGRERPRREGPDGPDVAQPSVRARSSAARFRRRHRRDQTQRADRRHRRARDLHQASGRAHVRAQHASRPVRALQSHVESGVHGRAGVRVEPRPGHFRQRQSIRHGELSRSHVPPWTGQQRLRISRHWARSRSRAARVVFPMSSFWLRPGRSRDWSRREISTRGLSIRRSRTFAGFRSRSPSAWPRPLTR